MPSKLVFFNAPWSAMIEKTRRFWTVAKTISDFCHRRVYFFNNFHRFVSTSETWRRGEKLTDFSMFSDLCDFTTITSLSINRMQDGRFVLYLVQIGWETAEKSWPEKKKQIDRKIYYWNFEKFHFCKNGNIIIQWRPTQRSRLQL